MSLNTYVLDMLLLSLTERPLCRSILLLALEQPGLVLHDLRSTHQLILGYSMDSRCLSIPDADDQSIYDDAGQKRVFCWPGLMLEERR